MTQEERTIKWLKENKKITVQQGYKYLGNTNLPVTIKKMIEDGWNIEKRKVNGKNRYGEKRWWIEYKLKRPYQIRKGEKDG